MTRIGCLIIFCAKRLRGNSNLLFGIVAAFTLKHIMHGDFNLVSTGEVFHLVEGEKSTRIDRYPIQMHKLK